MSLAVPARWAVGLGEPLLTAQRHLELEMSAADWSRSEPRLASAWFAGWLWQIAQTLPLDDPWRRMTVRWPLAGGGEIVKGDPPDGAYGCWLKGQPVKDSRAGGDIVYPSNQDLQLDAGLVALEEGIGPSAACLLGLSCLDTWQQGRELLENLSRTNGVPGSSPVFDTGAQALRWMVWRRRVYVGRTDPYPLLTAFAWLPRAERLDEDLQVDIEACRYEIETERIDRGAWGDLHSIVVSPPFFPGTL